MGRAEPGCRAHPKCLARSPAAGEGLQLLWKHVPDWTPWRERPSPAPTLRSACPTRHQEGPGHPGFPKTDADRLRAPSRVLPTSPSWTPSSPQQATPRTKRGPFIVLVSGSLSWGGVSDAWGPFPRVLKASASTKVSETTGLSFGEWH